MEELIKKHKETQDLIDKTIMEIGLNYLNYYSTQNKLMIDKINDKVEMFQKLKTQLQIIEKEIREMKN